MNEREGGGIRRALLGAVALAAWLACLQAHHASAAQTSNYELRAVPVPGRVTIDGKLDDWDLSGGILMCYDTETLLDTNSVRAYLMYDSTYLYAAFHFKDRTPMINHVDPKVEWEKGWRSDCVQLRFWTDAEKPIGPGGAMITHVDCYYFTDEQRPTACVNRHDISRRAAGLEGRISEAIGRGVEAAFRKDADGKGYVQEMAIEWELIRRSGEPYLAGESFRMGLECFWGDGSGFKWYQHRLTDLLNPQRPQREFFWANHHAWGTVKLMAKGHIPPQKQAPLLRVSENLAAMRYSTKGPVEIRYETPAAGRVTLVIEKPDGTRVRNLISNYPRPAGRNVDYWDGTNDDGALVAPGKYRVRGLWHPEFDVLYQFAFGNPGQPQWETPDQTGAWLSDRTVNAVAADQERIYLAGNYHDCGVGVIALDYEGRKLWGRRQPVRLWPGMAPHGKYLYMASGSEEDDLSEEDTIILGRVDVRTGKPVPFPGESAGYKALVKVKGFPHGLEKEVGELVAEGGFNAAVWRSRVKGLATDGRTVYVPLFWEDEILLVDAERATIQGHLTVRRPAGVALDGKGHLFVVAAEDRQVLRIDLKTRKAVPAVTKGLDAPIGLAIDREGNLYVSDQGRAMCVKVFSPRTGSSTYRLARTVGKPGGRPWVGAYDPGGMLLPYGVALDGRGRLWVAEFDGCPRRISVWNENGRLEREFCDAHDYAGMGMWIDPLEPTRALAQGTEFELDWQRGLCRTVGTVWRAMGSGAYFGGPATGAVVWYKRRDLEGRNFLLTGYPGCLLSISERKGDRYQPLAAIGNVETFHNYCGAHTGSPVYNGLINSIPPKLFMDHLYWLPELTERARRMAPKAFLGVYWAPVRAYMGKILQIFQGVPGAGRARLATTSFIWSDRNGDACVQEGEVSFFQLPGVEPIAVNWDWQPAVLPDLTIYGSRTYLGRLRVWKMPVKGWTACGAPIYEGPAAKMILDSKVYPHPSQGQWADARGNILSNHSPLTMYSPQGKVLWTYPNPYPGVHASHLATKARYGLMVGPLRVIGSVQVKGVGEVFAFNGNQGQAFLLTSDGLYVGELFRDARSAPDDMPSVPRRGESHRNTTMSSEWFGGQLFRSPRDGKPYVVGEHHSAGGPCIYEVTGLDEIKLLPAQRIAFDRKAYAAAEKLLAEGKAGEEKKAERLVVMQRLKRPAGIDGEGSEYSWASERRVAFAFDVSHSAEALAAYDDQNLYLFYRVQDESPLVNLGQQGVRYLFKSGDCVLFELATERAATDASPKPAPGDIRLLLARQKDKNLAVLYRYVAPGAKDSMEVTSVVMKVRIDEVRVLDDVKIATKRTAYGYTLEAAVPLASVGFKPVKGRLYRADFGVIYGDKQGIVDRLRMNWANKATGLTADAPSEALIRPRMWGQIRVEKEE